MKFEVGHRYLLRWDPYISVKFNVREWIVQEVRETAIKFRDAITNEVFWKERGEMESQWKIIDDLGIEPGYKPLEL